MAQLSYKKAQAAPVGEQGIRGLREGLMVLFVFLGVYLLLALLTYNPLDPGWSQQGFSRGTGNAGGVVGAWFADLFFYVFGYLAFLTPVAASYAGWLIYQNRDSDNALNLKVLGVRWGGFVILLCAGCGIATLHLSSGSLPLFAGGALGALTSQGLLTALGTAGATILLFALFMAGVSVFSGLSWVALLDLIGKVSIWITDKTAIAMSWLWSLASDSLRARAEARANVPALAYDAENYDSSDTDDILFETHVSDAVLINSAALPARALAKPAITRRVASVKSVVRNANKPVSEGLPPLSILDPPQPSVGSYTEEQLESMSRLVERKLADFGIEVVVVAVLPGPVITRFELRPAAGIKVSRISSLSKDLARALSVVSVRIVEVIPGKSVVGLEIPNEHRELVGLREIFSSKLYQSSTSPITLALGKDISGKPVVADLGRMPHLLVAGTTGSGKSVGVNAMLLSMLYKSPPSETRLILIDPKMLELSVYEGIPHLLAPVVTDMKDAANALRWCVAEMERRYKLMSKLGVRNLAGFNRKILDARERGETIPDPIIEKGEFRAPEPLDTLPVIVVVVDEFADMMLVVGKKVEELIARLAQKARASGIHLILATQRPSVDVITGLIKANIPSRIAFQVSSKIDSRTILDQMGADALLGNGDMLYLPPGTSIPERVHGAFVSDQEVHRVVDYLKAHGEPNYIEEVLQEQPGANGALPGLEPMEDSEADPLYDRAVAIVTETRKASISYVQRRLKIGYNRAARMVEEMESAGVVSAVQSNGNREVLAPPPPKD